MINIPSALVDKHSSYHHSPKQTNINNNIRSETPIIEHSAQKSICRSVTPVKIDEEMIEVKNNMQGNLTEPMKIEEEENIQIDPETGLPIGRVIMETEIMLDDDTSVTMTIHEQDDEAVKNENSEVCGDLDKSEEKLLKIEQNGNDNDIEAKVASKPSVDEDSEREDSDSKFFLSINLIIA